MLLIRIKRLEMGFSFVGSNWEISVHDVVVILGSLILLRHDFLPISIRHGLSPSCTC